MIPCKTKCISSPSHTVCAITTPHCYISSCVYYFKTLMNITVHCIKAKDRLLKTSKEERVRTEDKKEREMKEVKTNRTRRSRLHMLYMPRDSQHIPDMFNLFTNRQWRECVCEKVRAQKRTQLVRMLSEYTD